MSAHNERLKTQTRNVRVFYKFRRGIYCSYINRTTAEVGNQYGGSEISLL